MRLPGSSSVKHTHNTKYDILAACEDNLRLEISTNYKVLAAHVDHTSYNARMYRW
jgi:hypothetical protein